MAGFPFYRQMDSMDCGPACLKMIAGYYGRNLPLALLRDRCHVTRDGVSMLGISDGAEETGFSTRGVRISWEQLKEQALLPCIVHWKQNHFIVVYKIRKDKVWIADPAVGLLTLNKEAFYSGWIQEKSEEDALGLALLLEPNEKFKNSDEGTVHESPIHFLYRYVKNYRSYWLNIFLGLLFVSAVQLAIPFITQLLVDQGIRKQDIPFIYLLLAGQLVLFLSRMSVEYIRNWLLLHLSSRVNIRLISDFLRRMVNLPMSFFEARNTGDIMQRIQDHRRIETLVTSSSLEMLFSLVNVLVFSVVIALYSRLILFIFLAGTVLYLAWLFLFMRKRRTLDQQEFEQLSASQNSLIQMVSGIQDVKLNNSGNLRTEDWERIQVQLFKTRMSDLSLMQKQQSGALLINELKNIIITFYAALAVVHGEMSLGMMLALQFIVGQLNAPFAQLLSFLYAAQDANVSLERLREVLARKTEREEQTGQFAFVNGSRDLTLKQVFYQYEGPRSPFALKDLTLTLPAGKTTALVGSSGSGKTTLLKIILGFISPVDGDVHYGEYSLRKLDPDAWRSGIGAVMQDGFVFSDSIAGNIAMSREADQNRLVRAAEMACILDEINELPLGFNTRIGADGLGLSQGQKQRILIARAIYKDPDVILLDEATNSLDANTERRVMENLQQFFKNRTVLVVAHRLSTVKNADRILVLEKGQLAESGTHAELVSGKGIYYQLIVNQLELGGD